MEGIVHRFYCRISEQLFTEQLHMAVYKNNEAEIVCSYHVTYEFQSESTLYTLKGCDLDYRKRYPKKVIFNSKTYK